MKTLLSTLFGLFMILSMNAQVGVNNPTPEQALDVNGKVKLTNDATAPTAGTMRYDATSSDFEGYNGSQWNSFTQSRSSSSLPSNPVPVYGYTRSGSSNNELGNINFKRWADEFNFVQVPAGKHLIVTSIFFIQYAIPPVTDDDKYSVRIGPAITAGNYSLFWDGALLFSGKGHINNMDRDNSQSPIFILRPGEYLNFSNDAPIAVFISVRGFLVDNLNY